MSAARPRTEEAVIKTLASRGDLTVAELAAATGLARSTVARALAALEDAAWAHRSAGGRQAGRRLPDRWSVGPNGKPSRAGTSAKRLGRGQLNRLVLDYLTTHSKTGPLGATAIANALGRSAGAVGNCLRRLTAAGHVRQVSDHPRRYSSATPRTRTRHGHRRPTTRKPS